MASKRMQSAFALVAAVIVGATVAGCGGSSSATGSTATTAAAASSTTTTAPAGPTWTSLGEQVVAASTTALLENAQSSTSWTVVGTNQAFTHSLSPGVAGTTITCPAEDYTCGATADLIEPSAGHAQGETVFAFLARTPASGLTPAATTPYLQFFDNATGQSVQTVPIHGYPQEPAGQGNDPTEPYPFPTVLVTSPTTITLAVTLQTGFGSSTAELLNVGAQSGTIGATDTSVSATSTGGFTAIGDDIVDPHVQQETGPNECIFNIIAASTLTSQSTPPFSVPNNGGTGCPDEVTSLVLAAGGDAGLLLTQPLTDGYAAALDDRNATGVDVNLATAQMVTQPIQISGPRSTLGAAWQWQDLSTSNAPTGDFNTYTLATTAPVFNLPASQVTALSLQIDGMADNDLWVKTSDQNNVVDGTTGKTLATSWTTLPLFGAPGWTVVRSNDEGASNQSSYLVRTSGPLYNITSSNPPANA